MPTKRKRTNLQWKRIQPGVTTAAPNTLSSSTLLLPTDFNADDDYTLVKAYVSMRVSCVGSVSGLHNVLGAVGIIKRDIPADSAQFDPINEDAPWLWWHPIILSSSATDGAQDSFHYWEFEVNASRMIQRFEGITAYLKTRSGTTDSVTWSVGGSFLFYKP